MFGITTVQIHHKVKLNYQIFTFANIQEDRTNYSADKSIKTATTWIMTETANPILSPTKSHRHFLRTADDKQICWHVAKSLQKSQLTTVRGRMGVTDVPLIVIVQHRNLSAHMWSMWFHRFDDSPHDSSVKHSISPHNASPLLFQIDFSLVCSFWPTVHYKSFITNVN